jgi:hypothetical protein
MVGEEIVGGHRPAIFNQLVEKMVKVHSLTVEGRSRVPLLEGFLTDLTLIEEMETWYRRTQP